MKVVHLKKEKFYVVFSIFLCKNLKNLKVSGLIAPNVRLIFTETPIFFFNSSNFVTFLNKFKDCGLCAATKHAAMATYSSL